jgi:hypothetical protein
MSGTCRRSSSNATRSSWRARWAPRQKCAPAATESNCACRPRAAPNVIREFRLVPVGRGVSNRDFVAGLNPCAAEFCVLGQRPSHVRHRRRPAQDLFDGRVREIASFFRMLVIAGSESTRYALSHGVLALLATIDSTSSAGPGCRRSLTTISGVRRGSGCGR